jgi:hypothetical protein
MKHTFLILACFALAISAASAETSLVLISDSGDYIGAGQTQVYTESDGSFSATSIGGEVVSINFSTPTFSHFWFLNFGAPFGQDLAVGSYYGATRYPFQQFLEAGLDISGDGRGCNTLTGSFQVKQLVLGPGGTVASFWAVFEQHCEGNVPALRGSILFNADAPVAVTAPLEKTVEKGSTLSFEVSATDVSNRPLSLSASPMPAGASFTDIGDGTGLFTWSTGFNQAGTYDLVFRGENDLGDFDNTSTRITVTGVTSLLLDSEPGDFIGLGQRLFLTPEDGVFHAFPNVDDGVSVSFGSDTGVWGLDFAAPFDAPLQVGTYSGAMRWPFQGDQAGLSISGNGRGCNTLTGSFEVKQIVYGPVSELDAFWATFEQHCEGNLAALRGEIRFKADVPLLIRSPFHLDGLETQTMSFPVTALSASGGPIQLTATELPEGAVFTDHGDNTGTFEWTPSEGQAGSYSIVFQGDDGNGLTDKAFAQIQISLLNDDFDHAIEIASLPFSDQFDPASATAAQDDPSCFIQYPGIWYRFTATTDATLVLSAGGSFPADLSVHTGTRGALNLIGCTVGHQLTFNVLGGQTYFILVAAPPEGGPVSLLLENLPPPPPNDDLSNATAITALPFEDQVDTRTSILDGSDPSCLGQGATVWYRLTLPADTLIDANTSGSDYLATVSVYTGSPGALVQTQCSSERILFNAQAGQTYFLMVGSYGDLPGGHLKLSVIGLPPFTLDVSIEPAGLVINRTGEAYVQGSFACSRASQVIIAGRVRQRLGRAIVSAFFQIEKECDGSTGWSALLRSDSGLFTGGKVDVEVSVDAIDFQTGGLFHASASEEVHLRGAKSLPASLTAKEPAP